MRALEEDDPERRDPANWYSGTDRLCARLRASAGEIDWLESEVEITFYLEGGKGWKIADSTDF